MFFFFVCAYNGLKAFCLLFIDYIQKNKNILSKVAYLTSLYSNVIRSWKHLKLISNFTILITKHLR